MIKLENLNENEMLKQPTPREQEFLDLLNNNLLPNEIISAMGISPESYRVYLYKLRKKGLIPPANRLKFVGGKFRTNTELEERVQYFVRSHEDYFKLPSNHKEVKIEQVEEVVKKLNYRKQDVNLLIRVYIERNLYEEAINLLYDYETNTELSEVESKRISRLKHKLRIEMFKSLTGKNPEFIDSDKELFSDEER